MGKVECRICKTWGTYDPRQGWLRLDIPPGTGGITSGPRYYCPNCRGYSHPETLLRD